MTCACYAKFNAGSFKNSIYIVYQIDHYSTNASVLIITIRLYLLTPLLPLVSRVFFNIAHYYIVILILVTGEGTDEHGSDGTVDES